MPEQPAIPEPPAKARAEAAGRPHGARWLVALAGLIAGLAAFGIGEATYKLIPAQKVKINTMGIILQAATAETQSVANVRNAALAFGVLGACLGGCLGVAGGLARRSAVAAAGAGLLGLLLGAGLCAGVSLATVKPFTEALIVNSDYDIIISMSMHGLLWGLAGAAAGLAFAVGLGGGGRLVLLAPVAGFIGAVLGAIAFDLVGAGLFSQAETGEPISTTWTSRLVARLLVALATAAGVILILPAARPAGEPRRGPG